MADIVLEVKNLHTTFFSDSGTVPAVDGVDFTLDEGKTLAIVGESGSGKTVTSTSILRLLDDNAEIEKGEIFFTDGEERLDLTKISLERLQKIRSVLEEVREELKADSADSVYSSDDVEQPMADEPMADMTDAVVEESAAEEIVDEKPKKVAKSVVTKIIEPSEQPSEDAPASAKKRVVRRKKRGEEEDKELFAFYEQSLF